MCRRFWVGVVLMVSIGVNAQETPKKQVFEVTFEYAVAAENIPVVLSDFSTLKNVKAVCNISANVFRLEVGKGFVIEQIKPTVEKLHLAIESYTEGYYSYSNLCSEKDKLKD